MLSAFENKDDIVKAVSTIDQSDDETKVFIGSENMVKIMDDSTLIYKNLKLNGKTIGAIGIIGPCRMDYSKVLAIHHQSQFYRIYQGLHKQYANSWAIYMYHP